MDKKKVEAKNFDHPDEVREIPNGKIELVKFGDKVVGKVTYLPGFRWSSSIKPIVKTESCEARHFQYHVSGVMRVRMDDGTEYECKAGDVSSIPPGHDGWVVGNEPVVLVDFLGMANYAKKD